MMRPLRRVGGRPGFRWNWRATCLVVAGCLVSGTSHSLMTGMEFSEHAGEHSWRHKVKEHDVAQRLFRAPAGPRLWAALADAVAAQGERRADEARAYRTLSAALKQRRKRAKQEEL